MTTGLRAALASEGRSPAKAFRPSASTTTGIDERRTSSRTSSTVREAVVSPGPTTRASLPRIASSTRAAPETSEVPSAVSGSDSLISSGTLATMSRWRPSGTHKVTRPAPDLSAASPAMSAAPLFPREPATTWTCPKVPLWLSGARAAMARLATPASICSIA